MSGDQKTGAGEPPAGRRENQKAAGRSPRPSRKQNWWNKTSNTNKILIFIGAGGLFVAAAAIYFSEMQHRREHRPRIIYSRPPELVDPITCDTGAGTISGGKWHYWVKNIGNSQANNVVPYEINMKLVPTKRTGKPIIDDVPRITSQSCDRAVSAKAEEEIGFPVAPGVTIRTDVGAMTGGFPKFDPDAAVQLYLAMCVRYRDEHGKRHGTCDTYRLGLPSGETVFTCGAPVRGTFRLHVTGRCAN